MKTLAVVLLGCAIFGSAQNTFAQGTAFTYQGRLNDSGTPATGLYDLTFSLFDVNSGSSSITTAVTNSAVGVTNGLFTVTLDFGANFPGANRWLEIGVRTNGADSFTTILPRQPLTPIPYAITASNLSGTLPAAQLSGTLTSAQIGGSYSGQVAFNNPSNSFTGDGGGLTNINAGTLGGLSAASFWKTTGNAGTSPTTGNFLGTTDNSPLELWVNNRRALRLEPTTDTPNIIGGWSNNAVGVGVAGATITGGGTPDVHVLIASVDTDFANMSNAVFAQVGTIGGGAGNQIGNVSSGLSRASTISGGLGNGIDTVTGGGISPGSTIGGGILNRIVDTTSDTSYGNTIAGGYGNQMTGSASVSSIGGGLNNSIVFFSYASTIGGGAGNRIDSAEGGTIAGGENNTMAYPATGSTIGGGAYNNIARPLAVGSYYCTIPGGYSNDIQGGFQYSTIGGGFFNRILDDQSLNPVSSCTIAGGDNNTIQRLAPGAFIGGGSFNLVRTSSLYSVIGGGYSNMVNTFSAYSVIGGGSSNKVNGSSGFSVISGGFSNLVDASSPDSVIGGGVSNSVGSFSINSIIAGGAGNSIHTGCSNSVIGGGVSNQNGGFSCVVAGGANNSMADFTVGGFIGGGLQNVISLLNSCSVVAGGQGNRVSANQATIGGGAGNWITAGGATIAGGTNNIIFVGPLGTIAGGGSNFVNNSAGGTIGGGIVNVIGPSADYSAIVGGQGNSIQTRSTNAAIGGGHSNQVTGSYGTVSGGFNNIATSNSFAAGSFAQATNQGAFVWADYSSSNFVFGSVTTNEFAVRASGGARFVTAIDSGGNPSAGVALAAGSTSWATISDRNAKKDFAPVNGESVLDKLHNVPVEQWHYKWETESSTPHIGPMAQDFKHAFYPGRDDKSITTLEFDGVELAAIEGLNEKLKAKDAQIADLEQRLARLEKIISTSEK